MKLFTTHLCRQVTPSAISSYPGRSTQTGIYLTKLNNHSPSNNHIFPCPDTFGNSSDIITTLFESPLQGDRGKTQQYSVFASLRLSRLIRELNLLATKKHNISQQ